MSITFRGYTQITALVYDSPSRHRGGHCTGGAVGQILPAVTRDGEPWDRLCGQDLTRATDGYYLVWSGRRPVVSHHASYDEAAAAARALGLHVEVETHLGHITVTAPAYHHGSVYRGSADADGEIGNQDGVCYYDRSDETLHGLHADTVADLIMLIAARLGTTPDAADVAVAVA